MAKPKRQPAADVPVKPSAELTVLNAIDAYKREAEDAKKDRVAKDRINMATYMGNQDWSHKQAGQSREFLPKVPVAVEQFSAFLKRALIQFGDWFSVDVGRRSPLRDVEIRALMELFLGNLADGFRKRTTFALRLSDGGKVGLLKSLMVFKVHGYKVTERQQFVEAGTGLGVRERAPWRLAIDLVQPDDYYPDPSGRGLYEIHTVERDLHDVKRLAEMGIYDKQAVADIEADFQQKEDAFLREQEKGQNLSLKPDFRKRVIIDECWGDFLDEDGNVVLANGFAARANDKFLIRKPQPNPFWHGMSPFVAIPIIRVPDSVWHKALYDHASPLNLALNELFNLMLDGGLASVWGIKQARVSGMENPSQISGGIPQGITIAVKEDFPQGEKVVETVATGQVPQDALAMFNLADREFQSAALTNDLKLGMLPPRQVKATEVVESSQSQAVTLDGISTDIEQGIVDVLTRAWLTMLQNTEDWATDEIISEVGPRVALMLSRMNPAQRFALLGQAAGFKVHGLSATLAKVRDFQKQMAFAQASFSNPFLAQAFVKRFSADKMLTSIMKSLNINPDNLQLTDEEKAALPQTLQQIPFFQQMLAGPQGQGGGAQTPGLSGVSGAEPQLPAEINQQGNAMTTM
jgi:hypothetical protein